MVTTALLGYLLLEADRVRPEITMVEDLIAWTLEPNLLPLCRFGKHYGKPWSEVPKDYLQWMLKTVSDLDPDTRFTVEHWIRHGSNPPG
jgi:exodeoxyribonuclease X